MNMFVLIVAVFTQYNGQLKPAVEVKARPYVYVTKDGCDGAAAKETGPVATNDPYVAAKWAVGECKPIVVESAK